MTYFHGTVAVLRPGDLIEPGRSANFRADGGTETSVFLSDDEDEAYFWADAVADRVGGEARVYRVRPTGALRPDDRTANSGNYRSDYPLVVEEER